LTSKLPSMIHSVQYFEVLLDFGMFQFRVISIPGWAPTDTWLRNFTFSGFPSFSAF
jgi:hypothetical protein